MSIGTLDLAALVPDKYGLLQLGAMRVGLVEIKRLVQRRTNPRRMSDVEYATLKKSVERFGFKTFIVVEEIKPGQYGVIDGHHRWKLALEHKMERVPVVLLDSDTDATWNDLAMLTFNVSGDPIEEEFVDLLAELTQKLGAEDVAAFTALDPDFLENFEKDMKDTIEDLAKDTKSDEEHRARGHAITIELPRVDGVKELLEKVCRMTGEEVVGQAVVQALGEWVETFEGAAGMDAAQEADA